MVVPIPCVHRFGGPCVETRQPGLAARRAVHIKPQAAVADARTSAHLLCLLRPRVLHLLAALWTHCGGFGRIDGWAEAAQLHGLIQAADFVADRPGGGYGAGSRPFFAGKAPYSPARSDWRGQREAGTLGARRRVSAGRNPSLNSKPRRLQVVDTFRARETGAQAKAGIGRAVSKELSAGFMRRL